MGIGEGLLALFYASFFYCIILFTLIAVLLISVLVGIITVIVYLIQNKKANKREQAKQ